MNISPPQSRSNATLAYTLIELAATERPQRVARSVNRRQQQLVRMASSSQHLSNFWTSPDGRFWVRYYHNTQSFPFEWRISIQGGNEAAHVAVTGRANSFKRVARYPENAR